VQYTFAVTEENRTLLDRFLASQARVSLEEARDLICFGAVWISGERATDRDRVLVAEEHVTVHVPMYGVRRFYETDPGRILFRDPVVLAYDKEAGIACQPTPYDGYNNVYEGLRRWLRAGSAAGSGSGPARRDEAADAGYLALHHRLDLTVSGVMIFALSTRANAPLFSAFRDRQVEKSYRAVVCGEPEEDSWVERAPVGRKGGKYLCVEPGLGKEAETGFRVLRRASGRALVEALPRTGRTHQIRLHLALRGFPVLGDRQYGGRPHSRCMLHALRLSLRHPVKKEPLVLEAPMPGSFEEALEGKER
jgi:RluA family pseudouridine synthase